MPAGHAAQTGWVVLDENVPALQLVGASLPVVQKLPAAGAICVTKTTLPEAAFGMWGWSKLHGLTRNPFNAKYTSGGSSTGSAVSATLACSLKP